MVPDDANKRKVPFVWKLWHGLEGMYGVKTVCSQGSMLQYNRARSDERWYYSMYVLGRGRIRVGDGKGGGQRDACNQCMNREGYGMGGCRGEAAAFDE